MIQWILLNNILISVERLSESLIDLGKSIYSTPFLVLYLNLHEMVKHHIAYTYTCFPFWARSHEAWKVCP